ncbi:hypothetical protein GQR58_026133 [Nymphon striatum]|nr:hypothetical protein GQR58_026133 [Nymphon striatum]
MLEYVLIVQYNLATNRYHYITLRGVCLHHVRVAIIEGSESCSTKTSCLDFQISSFLTFSIIIIIIRPYWPTADSQFLNHKLKLLRGLREQDYIVGEPEVGQSIAIYGGDSFRSQV